MEKQKEVELSQRLKETREYLGLSLQSVANFIGISRAAVSSIEAGNRKVDTLELKKFSSLYKFPVSYLLGGEISENDTVQMLARTTKELKETDKMQVLKFAQFLRNINESPPL